MVVKMIVFDEKDVVGEGGVLNDLFAGEMLRTVCGKLHHADAKMYKDGFLTGYMYGVMWMYDVFAKMLLHRVSELAVYTAYKKTLEQFLTKQI